MKTFKTPAEQAVGPAIAEIFERLTQKALNPAFRGCAFGLAVAEHGESERIVGLARRHKSAVAEVLATIAERAGLRDAAQAGRHLALLYDGALARRSVYGGLQPMLEAKECALSLFDRGQANDTAGKL